MTKLGLIFILSFWTWLSLMPESRADICLQDEGSEILHISNTGISSNCVWNIREPDTASHRTSNKVLPFDDVIVTAANANQLDPALLHAVIKTESAYQPQAVSSRGAAGLMQLMPATARQLGVRDAYDPIQNIMAGARYLQQLQHQFNGDLSLTLAAYNAGPAAVKRHGNVIPPYAETRAYVPKVLQTYQLLSRETH